MNPLFVRLALGLLLGAALAAQSRAEVSCPASIPVQESLDLAKFDGWQTYDTSRKAPRNFFRVGFSQGSPDKLVFFTHTKTRTTKRAKIETYDFPAQATGDIWLSCLYSDSALALTKKLTGRTERCEVTYDPKTGFRTVLRIECF
jgi:hypothetical protein